MMRSMNSAVSSMKNHQIKMDVIGNNIANVNTIAFKGSRVTFKEAYNQLIKNPTGHSEARGGTNPSQVGLGMNINSVDNSMEKGSIDTTNIGTDVYIDGEGFFLVDSPDGRFYTRDGNFSIDEDGYLTTKDGFFVLGYQADLDGNVVEKLDKIRVPIKDVLKPKITNKIGFQGNISSTAGQGIKGNIPSTLDEIYDKKMIDPSDETKGFVYTIKTEFGDNVVEGRKSILGKSVRTTVVDSLGKKHDIKVDFVKRKDNENDHNKWDIYAFYIDSKGAYIPINNNELGNAAGPGKAFEGMQFTKNGVLDEESLKKLKNLKFTLNADEINGAAKFDFTMDFTKITQFEGDNNVQVSSNDGYELGSLTGMSIGADGKIVGKFDNGDMKTLSQIVTATFSNVNGLLKEGDNRWSPSTNSGEPNINKPGEGGNGRLISGALEMSNVDLAKEFTNMIITQRGFQANSRVITTTDQMLEELVNLKR